MTEQATTQSCPGTGDPIVGGFRQHMHAVECRGPADDPRIPHKVHHARCTPEGHLCPCCAPDWTSRECRHRRPGEDRTRLEPDEDSAKRIKASLDAAAKRRREREAARLQKDI